MRLALCSLLLITTSISAGELSTDILAPHKAKELTLDAQKADALASIEIDSWLNPILASYSASYKTQFGVDQENYKASIGIDQPIFKSGGIYFAIKYATYHADYNSLAVKIKRNSAIKQTIEFAMKLQQLDLTLKQLDMDIKDALDDLSLAKEQLAVGEIDMTAFNQRSITLNTLQMSKIDQENIKRDLVYQISLLSHKRYDELTLPKLTMIDKEQFMRDNLNVKQNFAKTEQDGYWKKVQVSNYLPAFNVQANYNYARNVNQAFNDNFVLDDAESDYTSVGFSISMPIMDVNMFKTIESAQVDYLRSKLIFDQSKKDEEKFYQTKLDNVRAIEKKKHYAIDSYKLYQTIYINAKNSYQTGDSSVLDLQKSEHMLEKKKLDIQKIYFDQQIELLALYEKMNEI
jgi:outer membrane protein TolC